MVRSNNHKCLSKCNKTNIMVIFSIAIIGIILLLCFLYLTNKKTVVIKIQGDDTTYVEYGSNYEEKGATAFIHNTTLFFLDKKIDVNISSDVTENKLGNYQVIYSADYQGDTQICKRNVVVRDTTPPEIKLVSNEDTYTPYNHTYSEEGYTAYDLYDGDVTSNVKSKENDGEVNYSVSDSSGNVGTAVRKIIYDDRIGPVITLIGGDTISIDVGTNYSDNFNAVDDCDGDVTAKTTVTGSVDSSTPGSYQLNYEVSDSHGNKSTAQRTVNVTEGENEKTIYLTYDDGPGPYTAQLLSILDKYNVKVTFFTTSTKAAYTDLIRQEAAKGHSVAVHTFSHNYEQVYASTDAYWSDFDAQNSVIAQQTGTSSKMFRFPGGSSNTISENYSKGIMTVLAAQSASKGYVYFDWNVSAGDAGGTTDTDTVYQNVITQVAANTRAGIPSVVLQHDVKEFSVNAVESIIQWGMANGYTFKSLNPGSFHAHHKINN